MSRRAAAGTALLLMGLVLAGPGPALPVAHAADDSGGVHLQVPGGFLGPIRGKPGAPGNVTAWVKAYPDREGATTLQVVSYEVGAPLAALPADQLGDAADGYLAQFLASFSQRHSTFEREPATRLVLGGRPAAMAHWRGEAKGKRVSGIMYTVVVGTRVILFQTQDLDPAPPENREAIVRAIETVSFDD